jgi:hypothetical protein
MFTRVRGAVGGAFLGDEMGLGKTSQAMTLVQVLFLHADLSYAVRHAVDVDDGRRKDKMGLLHLGWDAVAGQECPSRRAIKKCFGLRCVCEVDSPTGKFSPRDGMAIAQLPAGLIWNWEKDYDRFFDRASESAIQLWIAHAKASRRVRWNGTDPRFHCRTDGSPKPLQIRHLVVTSCESWPSHIGGSPYPSQDSLGFELYKQQDPFKSSQTEGREVIHGAVTADTEKDACSQQQTQMQPEKLCLSAY